MKKVVSLVAFAIALVAGPALADSYSVKQFVFAPETALNHVNVRKATTIEQVAQNVGNVATVKDLDAGGGDSFGSWQGVHAAQYAKNTVAARDVKKSIDQTAMNFGSDLTIKDVSGGVALAPQSVVADQSLTGPQTAINHIGIYDPVSMKQTAANTANTMSIDLPSSPSINTVMTAQGVHAPQYAQNTINVGVVGSVSQVAANAGNAVTINQ